MNAPMTARKEPVAGGRIGRTSRPKGYQFEELDEDNPQLDEGPGENVKERLKAILHRLHKEADRRVSRRSKVEQRWLDDLRLYHGKYAPDAFNQHQGEEERKLDSKMFINMTRVKADAMTARLFDMLFPTDDRNYGIDPTPVPEMNDVMETARKTKDDAEGLIDKNKAKLDQAVADNAPDEERDGIAAEIESLEGVQDEAEAALDRLTEERAEAHRKADLMEAEIEDLLKASGYAAEARDAIEDAAKIGFGVLKGPITGVRSKQRYRPVTASQAEAETDREEVDPDTAETTSEVTQYELYDRFDARPGAQRVDPWSCFPDPDGRTPADSDGFFERHLNDKREMRRLAREKGIDKEAIRRLITGGTPKKERPSYLTQLHGLLGDNSDDQKEVWTVWEYTGTIDGEDLEAIAMGTGNENAQGEYDAMRQAGGTGDPDADYEIDPLFELPVKIWFCEDEILKFAIHPLDSGEPIYSWFSIVRDETGPYGLGIPAIIRPAQDMLNAAGRMLMDNGRNAIGPQIIIDRDSINPQDGSYELYGNKVWYRTGNSGISTGKNMNVPFEAVDIPMRLQEIMVVVDFAMRLIDEITAMPQLAQGEQGAGVTKTAQGMAILMNSANVMFRRIVKNFDDDITVPIVRRFYHFLMQFSDKEEIKGDYEVDARGSSVLLAREMQATNLMMIAERFSQNPAFADQIKAEPLLKHIFRAHSIPADEILRTEAERREFREKMAKEMQGDPQAAALQAQAEAQMAEIEVRRDEVASKTAQHNREWDSREYIAELNWEADVMKIEADDEHRGADREVKKTDMDGRQDAQVTAELIRERRDARKDRTKERIVATEAKMARETDESGGGYI